MDLEHPPVLNSLFFLIELSEDIFIVVVLFFIEYHIRQK